jgi:hypothetical protein
VGVHELAKSVSEGCPLYGQQHAGTDCHVTKEHLVTVYVFVLCKWLVALQNAACQKHSIVMSAQTDAVLTENVHGLGLCNLQTQPQKAFQPKAVT